MSRTPAYLLKARHAVATRSETAIASVREKSEISETSLRFRRAGRYRIEGALLGVLYPDDEALIAWREAVGLPRAGVLRIQGEVVLIADVRAAMFTGFIDVIGVPPHDAA